MSPVVKILKVFLIILFLLNSYTTLASDEGEHIPRIADKFDVIALVPILENNTIVLIHPLEKDGRTQYVTGMVLIDRPFEEVWNTITDYNRYSVLVPNAERIEIVDNSDPVVPIVRYIVKFKVYLPYLHIPVSKRVKWTLAQHKEKEKREIWGIPISVEDNDEESLKGAVYREEFISVEDKTIFIYTVFANVESFGFFADLIYNNFPGLKIPTIISVATLFPEAMKQAIDNTKLVFLKPGEKKEIERDKIRIPNVAEEFSEARIGEKTINQILEHYRLVITRHPDKSNARFVTGLSRIDGNPTKIMQALGNYKNYYKHFDYFTDEASIIYLGGTEDIWSVFFKQEIKIILSLKIKFSLDYTRISPYEIDWSMNENEKKNNIKGNWGKVIVDPRTDNYSFFYYTQFLDLTNCSEQYRILEMNIASFDLGLRVGGIDVFVEGIKKWVEGMKE